MTQAAVHTLHTEGFIGGHACIVARELWEHWFTAIKNQDMSGEKKLEHGSRSIAHLQDRIRFQEK